MALVGCTASGKSEVAIELAVQLGDVEIVTVDSMQVYRGMDVGTAKPDKAARAGIQHHLIDLADPSEEWSVTRWAGEARQAINAIETRGNRALLTGGTGLYFQALVDGLTTPGRYPDVRRCLESEADTTALHRRLSEVDPEAAAKMEPSNRRRVVRALEVTLGSGRPFSGFGPGLSAYPPTRWSIAGLWLPRRVTAVRIARRFERMINAGLIDEVDQLRHRSGGLSRTARQALGYREILAYLENGGYLADTIEQAVKRTRSFARRQRVWWRRDPRITWYGSEENPLAAIPQILGDWRLP